MHSFLILNSKIQRNLISDIMNLLVLIADFVTEQGQISGFWKAFPQDAEKNFIGFT